MPSEGSAGLSKTQKRKLQKKRAVQRQRQAASAVASKPSTSRSHSLDVVHEDEHLIAINKPAGLLCHPSPGFWEHGTVVHVLGSRERTPGYSEISAHMLEQRQSYTGEADSFIPRAIVHRLDRGTTGLMLIAKTDLAETRLAEHFKRRTTAKTYIALLCGRPHDTAALSCQRIEVLDERGAHLRVEAPIGRDAARPGKVIVAPSGKPATSIVHVHAHERDKSGRRPDLSLVSVELLTGRQHQIRVHCAQCLGAPLANDDAYGGARLDGLPKSRPMLHAWAMKVPHPSAQGAGAESQLDVHAPLPEDMQRLISMHFPSLDVNDPSSWPTI